MKRPSLNRTTVAFAGFALTVVLVHPANAVEPPLQGLPVDYEHSNPVGTALLRQPSYSAISQASPNDLQQADEFSPEMLKKLMKPNFSFAAEWQTETNEIGIASYDSGVNFPTYPLFGPPPPFINMGFAYTSIDDQSAHDLPADLYETELGLAWMRRINDRWMVRFMAGSSFATDGSNNSSDAWRFRGGAFALYRRNPKWTWTFGAIALGRNDLPVLPAVGVIHQPNPSMRIDLIMPRPRLSFLLVDNGPRQQWGYIGAALNGTTWGVERQNRLDDQLTYADVRFVIGWESTPKPATGMPFTRGRRIGVEAGYVFSRDFEWDSDGAKIPLDDAWMLRGSVSF